MDSSPSFVWGVFLVRSLLLNTQIPVPLRKWDTNCIEADTEPRLPRCQVSSRAVFALGTFFLCRPVLQRRLKLLRKRIKMNFYKKETTRYQKELAFLGWALLQSIKRTLSAHLLLFPNHLLLFLFPLLDIFFIHLQNEY